MEHGKREGAQAEEDPEQQHLEGLEERVHKQSQQDDAPSLDHGPEQPSSSSAIEPLVRGQKGPTHEICASLPSPRNSLKGTQPLVQARGLPGPSTPRPRPQLKVATPQDICLFDIFRARGFLHN